MWEFIIISLFIALAVYQSKKLIIKRTIIEGNVGELYVRIQLEKLSKDNYIVLNDVMIKIKSSTSQIDHIVLSQYGIFVIETKNYSGWIHGNENSEYWVQTFYKNKIKFRNPIKQNWSHIYALKEILPEYKDIPYISIVVFAGSAKLKNISVKRTDVIYEDMLYDTIMGHRGIPVLEMEQIGCIAEKINKVLITDPKVRKEHSDKIHLNVQASQLKEDTFICPKCGGELKKRNGMYGEFFGCSNYPKCRYKMTI